MSDAFVRAACAAMGTRFELVIADCQAARREWGAIAEEALDLVAHWHARLTRFERGSYVRWLADQPAGAPIEIDGAFADLLDLCARVRRSSGGAFDVAGGRFGSVRVGRGPDRVTLSEPGVLLDFGAVAKGFVLDLMDRELRAMGVTSAFVHGGTSTARAIGKAPDGRPWSVRIGDAEDAPTAELCDAALSVSRNDRAAPVAGHVTDPATGRAANGAPIAAALGHSAAVCDAWSTALIVLGVRPDAMDSQLTTILPAPSGGWDITGPGAHAVRSGAEVSAA